MPFALPISPDTTDSVKYLLPLLISSEKGCGDLTAPSLPLHRLSVSPEHVRPTRPPSCLRPVRLEAWEGGGEGRWLRPLGSAESTAIPAYRCACIGDAHCPCWCGLGLSGRVAHTPAPEVGPLESNTLTRS